MAAVYQLHFIPGKQREKCVILTKTPRFNLSVTSSPPTFISRLVISIYETITNTVSAIVLSDSHTHNASSFSVADVVTSLLQSSG